MSEAPHPGGGAVEAKPLLFWTVRVYGFDGSPYDPVAEARTPGAARYAAFKAAREAGYFSGRDGFHRFLIDSQVRRATDREIRSAPRIAADPAARALTDPLASEAQP